MKFRYVSAGIHSFYHQTDDQLRKIQVESTYLGISDAAEYDEHALQLKSGDKVFLMTDGLYDLMPASIESIPLRAANLREEFEGFLGQFFLHDDVTMMIMELS